MPYAGTMLEKALPLSDLLKAGLRGEPDKPAVTSPELAMRWTDLDRASNRLAANYLSLGLKPGDRFASLMPNRAALVAHYLACFKAGLVLTPLNYRYTPKEMDHALGLSEAKILLAHAERAGDIAASKATSLPLGLVRFGGDDSEDRSLERLLQQEPGEERLPALGAEALAAIFFTSGSTGPAKGVSHTRETMGFMISSLSEGLEMSPADAVLPGSSCSHIAGFCFSMAALSAGARLIVARSFDHVEIGNLLRTTRPTVMSMLPTALLTLIRQDDITKDDFRSLRLVRSGGDKVSAELETEFRALTGMVVSEGYGMTEFGIAAHNPPYGVDKLGSIGRPLPGFVFSVRDDQDAEVPTGDEGRLWVKTPSQSVGYCKDEAATAEVMRQGWFDTGDEMKGDEDGYIFFRGRLKQIIVHDGSNISPQEVEDALLEHPAVDLVGVVGVVDATHGENVRAYVKLKAGIDRPEVGTLIAFAKKRVGYKAPEEIVFIDQMPMNASGKIDRPALKAMARLC